MADETGTGSTVAVDVVRAGVLDVAYERRGDRRGWPVVLLHGFPYAPRCYDDVVGKLAEAGADVLVPYLRGYGPTRFVDAATMRSGQQAAVAHDLRELIVALGLESPIVAGFDWGGRAACIVSALWPDLVSGLVTVDGYNVQKIAGALTPAVPEQESMYWYQYYLHGERGRRGLERYRFEYAKLLWQQWSPRWSFSDETLAATAESFQNPDFVDVVVHSYRHRYGLVDGDPAYEATEELIAAEPVVSVPTVVLDTEHDGLGKRPISGTHEDHFSRLVGYRLVDAGHGLPQENPQAFAEAVLLLNPR